MFGKKSDSWLIVGLGNPGKEYERTRHNCGFRALDLLANKLGCKVDKGKFQGLYGQVSYGGVKLLLLKPMTYMNLSGDSVREICSFFKVAPEKVIVICDDIALETGKLRIRAKGGAGGHNGLKSIIYNLKSEEFTRVRMGVGAPKTDQWDLADFVLAKFSKDDIPVMENAIKNAVDAISDIINKDVQYAMNKYNGMK